MITLHAAAAGGTKTGKLEQHISFIRVYVMIVLLW